MNWLKRRNLLVLFACSFVVMTQYQNCTPTELEAASKTVADQERSPNSLPVSVIDDVKSGAVLSFNSKSVAIHSEVEEVLLEGHCPLEQEGSVLGYEIVDSQNGSVFASGRASCSSGRFEVELAPTQRLECDRAYKVSARLGLGQPGETMIQRRCAPAAVADGSALKAQLQISGSSQCVIEKRESAGGPGCSAVCYNEAGVVSSELELDPQSCQM